MLERLCEPRAVKVAGRGVRAGRLARRRFLELGKDVVAQVGARDKGGDAATGLCKNDRSGFESQE